MDDMAEKITSLLSDPDGMEKIKGMAEALFGENKPAAPPPQSGGGLSLPEGFPRCPKAAEMTGRHFYWRLSLILLPKGASASTKR